MEVHEFLWHCSSDSKIINLFIFENLLSLTWCRRNTPNYQENEGLLETCFRLQTMLKVYRWRFLSFFGTAHVTMKLLSILFWKFHWVWRHAGGRPQVIIKMKDIRKIVFYFGSFTEFVLDSEECPKLSRKWRIYGKLFQALDTADVTQKLLRFWFWKFHWVWHDNAGMPQIIDKMMDFWKMVVDAIQC